jgi:hypothetical protein
MPMRVFIASLVCLTVRRRSRLRLAYQPNRAKRQLFCATTWLPGAAC